MERKLKADLKLKLRESVGQGCPIPRCGSPFLEYHHFDPPWAVEPHMNPEGMIPLCPTHHRQAESWTIDELRAFRKAAADRSEPSTGRFDWLKREFMLVAGGMVFIGTEIPMRFRGENMIWFERDAHGFAHLNVRMLTTAALSDQRLRISNSDFAVRGDPTDFVCPPSGRMIRAKYDNGDYLRLEFRLIESVEHAIAVFDRYADGLRTAADSIRHRFPVASLQLSMRVGSDPTRRITPNTLKWSGLSISGSVISNANIGLDLN